jgi:hypothetical protein
MTNNKRQGNAGEAAFLAALARARILAFRLPEPLRIVGPGRTRAERMCRLESDLGVDVLGVLPDGTALAAEAKTIAILPTSRDSALRWAPDDRLRGHQGQILADYTARGAVGLVYLQRLAGAYPGGPKEAPVLYLPSALYLLPWPDAKPAEGRASWRWAEMERWKVGAGEDWTRHLASREAWGAWRARGQGEPVKKRCAKPTQTA